MSEQPVPPSPTPPPPMRMPPTESQIRTWHMWCHLSALAILIGVPFGNVLGPLIVWQMKKNEIPSLDAHGKAAVNFQLTITLVAMALVIAGTILMIIFIGILLFPVAILVGICGIIFAIIAALKANDGKDYNYPYSFQFIK
jgi:hypothetical protein